MMDSPFVSKQKQQASSSHRRYSPIHGHPATETIKPTKVVSIPVHFVGSETKSALKIQKVLRGFLVRKSVLKIGSILKEVEEIERRIWDLVIRKDAKERLRINEMLMGSLFQLDSIRGIDVGVRDLRKSVIKKAIGLQEKLDAIAADHEEVESAAAGLADGGEEENEGLEENGPGANININMNEGEDERTCPEIHQQKKNDDDIEEHEQMVDGECVEKSKSNGDGEEERMNEKMIGMMNDLIQKNEIQTRLLASLTHRVALLEKAFLCDQLRKSHKKKKTTL